LKRKFFENNLYYLILRSFHTLDLTKNELSTSQKLVSTKEKKLSDQNQLLEKQSLQQDMKINHLNDLITS